MEDTPLNMQSLSSYHSGNLDPSEVASSSVKDAVGGEMPDAVTRLSTLRSDESIGLATFSRRVAVRMVTDYLSDLETLSSAAVSEHYVEVRKEDYRAALKDLQTSLERAPDTPLTMQEREIITRMLYDYMQVTKDRYGLTLDDGPKQGRSTVTDDRGEVEKFVVELRSPTWAELNDPRSRVWDESRREITELEASYPILLKILTAALQGSEAKFQEVSYLKDQVKVFGFQCAHVADTLAPSADEKFRTFRHTLALVENLRVEDLTLDERRAWFKCVTFCIRIIVTLTYTMQSVVDLLSACGAEEWWRTALRVAQVLPHPQVPRWTVFALALRQCQWNMDIATLAFFAMEKRYNLGAVLDSNDFVFVWSDKQRRLVLQLQGNFAETTLNTTEDLTASIELAMELEAKDISALILSLEDLKDKSIKKWKHFHLDAELIADFLITKLRGPTPHPSYLPWTFRINHATLSFKEYVDAGSYGMVAKYKWYREKVAVKSIRAPGLSRNKFEEEAAILGTVQHPNVVQLLGCGFREKRETGMLVMELMDHDLRTVIERRCPEPGPESSPPFPLYIAINIMLKIAEAMQYLREHKILHRDLKAKNILINRCIPTYQPLGRDVDTSRFPYLASLIIPEEFYTVKLADFGLAKVRPFASRVTVTHMAGTTAWRAPEVFHILDAEVAAEYKWPADVYSYAMTCYEILTGGIPFQGVPNSTIHSRILAGERPDLGLGNALPSLTELIERCWDTNPEKRPQFPEICKKLWQCYVEAILSIFRPSIAFVGSSRS